MAGTKSLLFLSVAVLTISIASAATIAQGVTGSETHTVLQAALVRTNLTTTLAGSGPFTLFAPVDTAFATLLGTLGISAGDLLAAPYLPRILLHHVVPGNYVTPAAGLYTTAVGSALNVTVTGAIVRVDGALVVATIRLDNGVIHVIDAVLTLPTVDDIIQSSVTHTVLDAALGAAELHSALDDPTATLTVFAPTNAAFVALLAELNVNASQLLARSDLADILRYHVVGDIALSSQLTNGQELATLRAGESVKVTISGSTVKINDATVIVKDLVGVNGVVHVIDKVLLVPEEDNSGTIAQGVAGSETHTVLQAALVRTNLTTTLAGSGPFTLFAPVDTAFATLLGTLGISAGDLLAAPYLPRILLHHVVPGNYVTPAAGLYTTAVGSALNVTVTGAIVRVDGALVVATIRLDNGVIHVIDAVLTLPTVDDIIQSSVTHTVLDAALGAVSPLTPVCLGVLSVLCHVCCSVPICTSGCGTVSGRVPSVCFLQWLSVYLSLCARDSAL
eukprot:jgi/Mesvir1/6689/Mv26501-RA.3